MTRIDRIAATLPSALVLIGLVGMAMFMLLDSDDYSAQRPRAIVACCLIALGMAGAVWSVLRRRQ